MKHRILVVEDNALNCELLCDWLEAHGHEVLSAEDIAGARQAIEDRPPDAVLLDVQLGDDDGLDASRLDAKAAPLLQHSRNRRHRPRHGQRSAALPASRLQRLHLQTNKFQIAKRPARMVPGPPTEAAHPLAP